MKNYARQIINWENPERPDGGCRCRTSSLLWARLLMAPSRVVFKDGQAADFSPATLESVEIAELDVPKGPDMAKTGDIYKCVVFTLVSDQPDMRIRVRAYHHHNGQEFGHPGDMELVPRDAREWDAAYKQLQDRMNTVLRESEVR